MPETYEPITTQTLSTASNSVVVMSSIPSTYTDLVLVSLVKMSTQSAGYIRFNSDSGTNYSATRLLGSGSSAITDRAANQTYIDAMYYDNSNFGMSVINIFNYSNATTNKSVLVRWSSVGSSDQYTDATVGLYRQSSPSAITAISLHNPLGNFSIGSIFTLYGIKAV